MNTQWAKRAADIEARLAAVEIREYPYCHRPGPEDTGLGLGIVTTTAGQPYVLQFAHNVPPAAYDLILCAPDDLRAALARVRELEYTIHSLDQSKYGQAVVLETEMRARERAEARVRELDQGLNGERVAAARYREDREAALARIQDLGAEALTSQAVVAGLEARVRELEAALRAMISDVCDRDCANSERCLIRRPMPGNCVLFDAARAALEGK